MRQLSLRPAKEFNLYHISMTPVFITSKLYSEVTLCGQFAYSLISPVEEGYQGRTWNQTEYIKFLLLALERGMTLGLSLTLFGSQFSYL